MDGLKRRQVEIMSRFKYQTLPRTWRWLGLLPLAFFIARLIYFSNHGGISQILWLCHLSNLTLAIGLLFDRRIWIGISAYWLVLGIPFWIVDILGFGMEGWTSAATHLGGTIISIWALSKLSPPRHIWHFALVWYLILQLICRLFTPPELNINIAHAVYRGWESMFANYFLYWLLTTLGAGLAVYLLDIIRLARMLKWKK
jgi:hypothetical protein